jgi:hypothetical protein
MGTGTPGRAVGLFVKWAFLIMGILFLAGSLISAHRTQSFLRQCVTAQGKVVALKPVHSSRNNSISYAPVFRFDVPGWHFATVVSHTSSRPPAFKVGEGVTVLYQPGHPEDAVIDSFGQLWLGDLVFGIAGAMSIGMALLIFVASPKVNRDVLVQPDSGSGITRL